MLITMYAKCCISILIVIAVLELCAANEIEILQHEAALEFAQKWLAIPKMYVDVIIPNKYLSKARDILKLIKKTLSGNNGRNAYFIFKLNQTIFKTIPHTQSELIWYPFDIGNYGMDCLFLDSSRDDLSYKKHFLLLDENKHNYTLSFGSCKIQFDSRLVVYRKKPKSELTVEFEEIYKIDENQNRLEKNDLGEIIVGRNGMRLALFSSSIWNRRKSLKGKVFNAVSLSGSQMTMTVMKSKDSEGNSVISYSGYHADVMRHLMQALNFSLNTTVSDKTANDIVMEVGSGRYDIGLNSFAHILSRDDYADYSLEILDSSVGLFYFKEQNKLYMQTFLDPFASQTWILLNTYIVVMISGFIPASMVIGNRNHVSTRKRIIELLQKGSDVVLRSVISKRQSSEPLIFSSKTAFLVLVLTGFSIFSMYRAVLVAFLATEEDNPPIRNLKELINSEYSLAVPKGTAEEAKFVNAPIDSDEHQVHKNKKIVTFPRGSANEFANLMVGKDPKASKTVLYWIYEVIQMNDNYPCKLALIKGSRRKPASEGMIFQKGWPWTDFFNYHLLEMKESGLMERLYKRNMKKPSKSCPNEYMINRIVKTEAVGINKIFSLYVALLGGFGTSLLILLVERLSA